MINVGCATDNNYAQHLGVMIFSLLCNSNYNDGVKFYIVDGGISAVNKDKLLSLKDSFHCDFEFIQPDISYFDSVKALPHFGMATYYRLYLVETIQVDKLIFLDCDMIVLDDVSKLLEVYLSGKPIAAVQDYLVPQRHLQKIKVPHYFNAGFMVIDVHKWNELAISKKSISFLINHIDLCEYADQDALNSVINGNWHPIDYRWNTIAKMKLTKYGLTKANVPVEKKEEVQKAIENPAIVHYANRLWKPWNWLDPSPYKKEYVHYKSLSPWREIPFPDKSISGVYNRLQYYFTFTMKHLNKKYR